MSNAHPLHLPTHDDFLECIPLTSANLCHAKIAYSVHRIPRGAMKTLLTGDRRPRSGDLVLAEIVRLGRHCRIELGNGRRAQLFPGDRVILCYGNHYAPDQFEAYVPKDLGPCQMVARSGIAARQHCKHSPIREATEILPLGLLGDECGRPLNLADWSLPARDLGRAPLTLAVLGTSANAGKTTTATHLIRGLRQAGLQVGAAKITGTDAGGDVWLMQDSGAYPVLDFTDAGFASTFNLPPQVLKQITATLCGYLAESGAEVIILEVTDGLLQTETATLLASDWFPRLVDGVILTATDALGAKAGVELLHQRHIPVLAVSGTLTASPLMVAETRRVVSCPVVGKTELTAANVLEILRIGEAPPQISSTL